jgi:hypothetical protein
MQAIEFGIICIIHIQFMGWIEGEGDLNPFCGSPLASRWVHFLSAKGNGRIPIGSPRSHTPKSLGASGGHREMRGSNISL